MKKQINFGLFLVFLFIAWLFVNTGRVFLREEKELGIAREELKAKQVQLDKEIQWKRERLAYDCQKLEHGKASNYRYAIYTTGDPSPIKIILDKVTGEAWRFFREVEDGKVKAEGWHRLMYNDSGEKWITPRPLRDEAKREKSIEPDKATQEKGKIGFSDLPEKQKE